MKPREYLLILLVLRLALSLPSFAHAQEGETGPKPNRIELLTKTLEDEERSSMTPVLVPDEFLDENGKKALRGSLAAYYEYRIHGFAHRERVFKWQLFSSKLIFVLVVSLVAVGVLFSWMQFNAGRKAGGKFEEFATKFEATTGGLKVSSPVLGVIILVVSFAFFYLYLVYVYPIHEIL